VNFSDNIGASYINTGDSGNYKPIATNSGGNQVLTAESPGRLYIGLLQLL
jgi:hypothetical protein